MKNIDTEERHAIKTGIEKGHILTTSHVSD